VRSPRFTVVAAGARARLSPILHAGAFCADALVQSRLHPEREPPLPLSKGNPLRSPLADTAPRVLACAGVSLGMQLPGRPIDGPLRAAAMELQIAVVCGARGVVESPAHPRDRACTLRLLRRVPAVRTRAFAPRGRRLISLSRLAMRSDLAPLELGAARGGRS
jgi:hypothetical protein